MDNILLIISHNISRDAHRLGGSWGASTINDSSDGLILKQQTNTPRPDQSSTSLSQVPTAYTPSATPPRGLEFVSPKVRFHEPRTQSVSPNNGIRVHPDVYESQNVRVEDYVTERDSGRDTTRQKDGPSCYESLEDLYQSACDVQYPKKTRGV
jgi:hypothetical protein